MVESLANVATSGKIYINSNVIRFLFMSELPTPDRILEVLSAIAEPKTQKTLVDRAAIRDIVVKPSGVVSFSLVNPSDRDVLIEQCKTAIKALPAVKDVWVKVISEAPTTPTTTSELSEAPQVVSGVGIAGVKHILAVSSGKGGVGKTSVAVNLAVTLAEMGAKVGILDADIYGPNVPVMLGMNAAQIKVTKSDDGLDIVEPAFNHGVKMISMAFLIEKDQPVMWRGPMLNGVIRQFLYQANWGTLDYLIVDMPPGTGDAQLTLTQSVPLAGAIIVTTPQTVSLLDSRKGLKMFQSLSVRVLGIVENMSYFIPPDMPDKQYDIFGSGGGAKTAAELDLPLLGCVPLEIGLREGGDRGIPITLSHPDSASAKVLKSIAKAIALKVSKSEA
jgi:ATP-binding protein involved in chromosome partitioning